MSKSNKMRVRALGWSLAALILAACTHTTNALPAVNLAGTQRLAATTQTALRAESDTRQSTTREYKTLAILFDSANVNQLRHQRHDTISVSWPAHLEMSGDIVIRIQTAAGRIFLERHFMAQAGAVADLGKAYLIPAGEYEIVLMPPLGQYYFEDVRIQRKIAITLSP